VKADRLAAAIVHLPSEWLADVPHSSFVCLVCFVDTTLRLGSNKLRPTRAWPGPVFLATLCLWRGCAPPDDRL
jgi:hypothetical protein